METVLFYLCTILLALYSKVNGRAIKSQNVAPSLDPETFLKKYGYMAKTGANIVGVASSGPDFEQSFRTFQQWNSLPVTGELDAETQKLMSTPRCGVKDPQIIAGMPQPFVLGPKWTKNTLTYKINNFSPDLTSDVIRTETERAFRFWTDVANIDISETSGTTDITILFASGDHGDGAPFDGEGGVLAHATFPEDGQCHFDDGENWVANATGTDYFLVAAHEIGHLLGLDHSNTRSALMYPFYGGYVPDYTIDADDRAAIITHYGIRTDQTQDGTTTTTRATTTALNPNNTGSSTTTTSIRLLIFALSILNIAICCLFS